MSSINEAVAAAPSTETGPGTNQTAKASLTPENYVNVVAYVLNAVLVYGVGTAGWVGADNGTLSAKYQSLVTPNGSAFSIWAVIFLSQGAFSAVQLLPQFRAHPMVRDGVGYWYSAVAATQVGWSFAFALEVIPLSLAFMLLIWASLATILYRQYRTQSDGSLWEFWLLRFPFAIHGGWITAASALNVNVQVVSMSQPAAVQLAVAIVSLAVLHAISVWVLFHFQRPNWTISCVLSWAFGFIYKELGDPLELITKTFSEDVIDGVRYAAIAVSIIIVAQVMIRLGLLAAPSWNPYKKAARKNETAQFKPSGVDSNV